MRILISNDDGIRADGLKALASVMSELGEVWVVAPDRERSGSSHSLTLHRPLRIFPRQQQWYAVDGTPSDCVNLAILEILKQQPPDIVVAGINHGANLGDDVNYSGTASVALEATIMGFPAIAFSLVASNGETPYFGPTLNFVKHLSQHIIKCGLPADTFLNVNMPNRPVETSGDNYEVTRLGKRRYASASVEKIDPRGKPYYWIGGQELGFENTPGTDSNALRQGRFSITPVHVDRTHYTFMEAMKDWRL